MALQWLKDKSTKKLKAVTFVAAAGLLAIPSLANAADETFNNVKVIPVPNLFSFDISWWDPISDSMYLADRSNTAIDVFPGPSFLSAQYNGNFKGIATTSSGAVNNDLSGPNGVLTFNNTTSGVNEIWVGDGPQPQPGCASFLQTIGCSAVKVINANTGVLTHTIITNGAARADEGCSDPVDHLQLWANDAEADFAFGVPFISFISTDTYQVVKGVQIPEATNGIEQCKWDSTTGLFFINLPEVNGPGNDTVDGAVYVYDKTGKLVAQYIIDIGNTHCAGPQGMAVGPEPQLLLGCNAPDKNGQRNSVYINKHTGQTLGIAWGLGGADEVWFNPSDSHYALTNTKVATHTLGIFDGTGAEAVDQILAIPTFTGPTGAVSQHSVAISTSGGSPANAVFVPNFGAAYIYQNSGNDSDDIASPQLSN
jgi:hypothetical protein